MVELPLARLATHGLAWEYISGSAVSHLGYHYACQSRTRTALAGLHVVLEVNLLSL